METVDTMTLDVPGRSGPLAVVRVLRNGRRCYDPADKARLIEACLAPGVSVARLALEHGVNANLLRNWIVLHCRRREAASALTAMAAAAPPAFVPVVEAAPIGHLEEPGFGLGFEAWIGSGLTGCP